ncbi:hypothetical protein [Paenibacillus sp. OSY-SE]|nr:hypothetical protein [Paenibacillus sp. OSY-SE]
MENIQQDVAIAGLKGAWTAFYPMDLAYFQRLLLKECQNTG